MATATRSLYWNRLCRELGEGWNSFWFTPTAANTLAALRICSGIILTYWLVTFSFDLVFWFGPNGLLPTDIVERLTPGMVRWSLLELARTPTELIAIHVAALIVAVLFTVGFWTRVTSILALIVCLSYAFRGPPLTSAFEPILSMLLAYLAVGRCGDWYSIDRWRKARKARSGAANLEAISSPHPTWTNRVSTRLIQLHTVGFCLMMALTQLGGAPWWDGSALWWLIVDDQSRIVNLTALRGYSDLLEIGAHTIVFFGLCFALLIWHPLARPILLPIGALVWLGLLLITGNVLFFVSIIVASWAFIPPELIGHWLGRGAART